MLGSCINRMFEQRASIQSSLCRAHGLSRYCSTSGFGPNPPTRWDLLLNHEKSNKEKISSPLFSSSGGGWVVVCWLARERESMVGEPSSQQAGFVLMSKHLSQKKQQQLFLPCKAGRLEPETHFSPTCRLQRKPQA